MKKLFMVGLGGSTKQSNIEVHDMQFIYAETIEDCFYEITKRWYGKSLHIDSYTEINVIDGYELVFEEESEKKLYMVTYGGYQKGIIDEVHAYHFLFAESKKEAKQQAKLDKEKFAHMDHIDEIVNVSKNAKVKISFKEKDVLFTDNQTQHTFIKLQ